MSVQRHFLESTQLFGLQWPQKPYEENIFFLNQVRIFTDELSHKNF